MQTCLVTGGAGFIGSHLAERLARDGRRVRVLDDLSTGGRDNLDVLSPLGVEFIEADIRDGRACQLACEGMDVVFHQAALASVPRSVAEPVLTHEVNVGGTLNVLLAARDAGCRRVVMASSSAVYGEDPNLPRLESARPQPLSPYAAQKLAAETYGQVFWHSYGFETVALRYFNVFGPRQDPASQYAAAIPLFMKACLGDERPVIFGDGLQSRDFTYVANVVEANLAAAVAPGAPGLALNVGAGGRITILDLVRQIAGLTGRPGLEPRFEPARAGDVRHSQADLTGCREALGDLPLVSLKEGLEETLRWLTEA